LIIIVYHGTIRYSVKVKGKTMSIRLRKIKRENPQDRRQSKWYLTQEKPGIVGIKDIATEIKGRSALSLGDVQSVLSNLVEVLPTFLKLGQSVRLEGFGSFRISVTSGGAAAPEELNARHVRGIKLLFLPSVDLKRSLEDISFEIPADPPRTPTAEKNPPGK
jgi:predicted histone-like DNA-binding protein